MDAMPDDHAALVMTTVGNADDAARIGRLLVEERLAACVTTVAGARSTYRWEGRVVEEEEQLLPEVLVLAAAGVPEPYARWLEESAG
jgi:uncharacterized protein involved in tolerance to divalent cations